MVSPIDYTLDVANPFQAAMQGFQSGQQVINNAEIIKAQRAAEARKQLEAMQQQQMKKDLYDFSLMPNKSYDDYSTIILKHPSLQEPILKSWELKSDGDKKQMFSTASQVYAALNNNQNAIAKEILDPQIAAYENSGYKQEALNLKNLRAQIDQNPQMVKDRLGMTMRTVDPEQFKNVSDGLNTLEMQPLEMAKTKAETAKINAEANDIPLAAEDRKQGVVNQGTKIEYDNQYNYDKLGQDQQQFIAGLDSTERIAAAKLRAAKNETSIQRVERLEKVENFANAAQTAAEASKNAARLANLANENSGAYWDRLVRQVPGTSENTFAKDIESLKSQVFLAQVEKMRGLGALTDREGDAIRSSIASLDINQGPEVVQKNLSKIAQQLSLAAQSANRKAQLYATKGQGYSQGIKDAAKELGISEAEAQLFANENGL
ncbi:hypothetical protein AS4_28630 [Acinetobacter guillouiae]|uniref:hypothetical protein n=1 Tax=Acinetobacter guillouiae TaxID=106649 RepID=UPI0004EF6467|nr:hypothetical protein [Acinetobacter guillouiae]BAP37803.1 hypothetical protein AS4_28630 [Acinetobacter guillouiae]